jgi:antitoxin component YwqK of YwqJK toxin-antitoxin module
MYFGNETNAFSGLMIERYPGGALQSRSALREGLLHGTSEGWFTNGVLQVREHFTNGVSHGLRAKFYPDGRKLSECPVVAGKIDGTFRRWHPNGLLAEEIAMHNNQPHGQSRSFHADGSLKACAVADNGKVTEQHFFPAKDAITNALSQVR